MNVVVDHGLNWFKSSFSTGTVACVELARREDGFALRDSKNPEIILNYTHAEIEAFVRGAKNGDFDQLLMRSLDGPAGDA